MQNPEKTMSLILDDRLRWIPLVNAVGEREAGMFMFMGTAHSASAPSTIFLYKHINSRRYLNIKENGSFWKYDGGAYRPIAQNEAMLGVFDVRPSYSTVHSGR